MTTMVIAGTDAVEAERQFQEKMKERMRAAMGDLMPDAVLAGIVAKGIDEAFFKPELLPARSSWGQPERGDAWTTKFIKEECQKQVREAVAQWIKDNPNRIADIVRDQLDRGVVNTVMDSFERLFHPAFDRLKDSIGQIWGKIQTNRN